jgi:ATP-dependent DNA helicase DinG
MNNQNLDLLKQFEPTFEPRTAQLTMMDTIDTALNSESINGALIEAKTGTGKTVGSLISNLKARKPNQVVWYVTPNVLLINEIAERTVPQLQKTIFPDLTATALIGKDRYVCINRLNEQYKAQADMKIAVLENSWNGVRDNYTGVELTDNLWREVKFRSDYCKDNCKYSAQCPYIQSKTSMKNSQLIITTYAMLFSLLELRDSEHDQMGSLENIRFIFDEAHQIPELIKNHTHKSFELSRLCGAFESKKHDDWCAKLIETYPSYDSTVDGLNASIDTILDGIYDYEQLVTDIMYKQSDASNESSTGSMNNTVRLDQFPEIKESINTIIQQFMELRDFFAELMDVMKEDNDQGSHSSLMDQCSYYVYLLNLALDVHSIMERKNTPVAWGQLDQLEDRSLISLQAVPLHFDDFLQSVKVAKTTFMSATLQKMGSFDWFIEELGLKHWRMEKLVTSSPFKLNEQAHLHVIDSIGSPRDQDYMLKLVESLNLILSKGKSALFLFNSHKQVLELEEELRYCTYDHGFDFKFQTTSSSRENLIRAHKADVDAGRLSAIVGVASFGIGLDLPGYLEIIVVGSLPFKSHKDPYFEAKSEYLEKRNINPFNAVSLPDTSLILNQWVGRLVRTSSCKGHIFITDERIVKKYYGEKLLSHLPDFGGKASCLMLQKSHKRDNRRTRRSSTTTTTAPIHQNLGMDDDEVYKNW